MFFRAGVPLLLTFLIAGPARCEPRVLDAKLHHLRVGPKREWADFPQTAEAANLALRGVMEALLAARR